MRFAVYFGLRFLFLIPQVLLISLITFILVRMLPGNPARMSLGPLAPESAVEALQKKWLLDRPMFEQYWAWLEKASTGNLGESWVNNSEVMDDLIHRIPVTLEIMFLALMLVLMFLVPLAIVTASQTKNRIVKFFQNITFGYGMLAGALPDFLLGLVLIFIFFTHAGILPGPEGRLGILDFESPFVTGSVLIDSLIAGDFDNFWSGAWHLIMPVFTLAFVYGAPIFKMLRSQMEGALRADYTTYAEAVGIKPRTVFLRAARVASAPTIVITGVVVMFLLGGAVLVETVFNLTGLGQYAVQGIVTADYAPLQGFVSFAAIFTMLVYLAVDLAQFAMDPRIKAMGSR